MTFQAPALPTELYDTLSNICKQYKNVESDQSSRSVAYADMIEDACKKFGYCEDRHFHVKQIGMHPCNRDGEGVHPQRANTRIEVLHTGGVSVPTLERGLVAMEDNPLTKHIAKFTHNICSQGPQYAKYNVEEIKGGTVAGSHCNHGFAQVYDETPCDIQRISHNGRLSQEECLGHPAMRKVVTSGATFKFYSWPIEYHFPTIPKILQSAYTTVTQVGEGVTMRCARGARSHLRARVQTRTCARARVHAHAHIYTRMHGVRARARIRVHTRARARP